MDSHYTLLNQYDDFEAFTEAVSGYDLEAQQLGCGLFSATSHQVVCGQVLLTHLTSTRRVEMRGNPPPKLMTFGIPTEACQPFVWRNQYSNGNTIQLYRDTTELEIVTQPFFAAIDLSIREDTLNQLCQALGLPELDDILGDNEMLALDPNNMRALRNAQRRICLRLSDDPSLISTPDLRGEIEYELPLLFLNTLCLAKPQPRRTSPQKRQAALKKAVDYIKAFYATPISLTDLCRESGVSARTLQHAFTDHFGLPPKAYLRVQRLNHVHKELLSSSPMDIRVSEIAYHNGFNHMGQFSRDYQKLFGILPSITLQQHR